MVSGKFASSQTAQRRAPRDGKVPWLWVTLPRLPPSQLGMTVSFIHFSMAFFTKRRSSSVRVGSSSIKSHEERTVWEGKSLSKPQMPKTSLVVSEWWR